MPLPPAAAQNSPAKGRRYSISRPFLRRPPPEIAKGERSGKRVSASEKSEGLCLSRPFLLHSPQKGERSRIGKERGRTQLSRERSAGKSPRKRPVSGREASKGMSAKGRPQHPSAEKVKDLLLREGAKIPPLMPGPVPKDGLLHGLSDLPAGLPAKPLP